jgi:murein DD-endopeptidase MepM/ murein hydrolase activator NlpD
MARFPSVLRPSVLRPSGWLFLLHLLPVVLVLLACDGDSIVATGGEAICEGYPPIEGSPYVLPYPVGASYSVLTANCDENHIGTNRYGYDFSMRSGTPLVAMRGGTVVYLVEVHSDKSNDPADSNHLVIDHGDGTFSTYFHMRKDGVVPAVGDRVERGELIAYSGASGTGPEHVHVHVKPCLETAVYCLSSPFQFVNAEPRPSPTGLEPGVRYTALPYGVTAGLLEPLPGSVTRGEPGAASATPERPAPPAAGERRERRPR